jgi:hypothetical protein
VGDPARLIGHRHDVSGAPIAFDSLLLLPSETTSRHTSEYPIGFGVPRAIPSLGDALVPRRRSTVRQCCGRTRSTLCGRSSPLSHRASSMARHHRRGSSRASRARDRSNRFPRPGLPRSVAIIAMYGPVTRMHLTDRVTSRDRDFLDRSRSSRCLLPRLARTPT